MPTNRTLIEYSHNCHLLEGAFYQAEEKKGAKEGAKGTVLISHTWAGRDEFVEEQAKQLSELGYNSFALDIYGKGILGSSPEENEALMMPFIEDRTLLQGRLLAALEALKSLINIDSNKIAAMGYCFGGLCSLDLARLGIDLAGVVSFHGLLMPPGNTQGNKIKAKVLVLHGYADPMATPENMTSLGTELTEMGADWQIHAYGNTLHAFTLPHVDAPDMGAQFNSIARDRSWQAMLNFFDEIFN